MRSTYKVTIGSNALSDHLSRLYDMSGDGILAEHIDMNGALIYVTRPGKQTCDVEMTWAAVCEFIDDLKYQIEWSEESSYKQQCRRALTRLQAVTAN